MNTDLLKTLREAYNKNYVLKESEYDLATELRSITDVLRDVQNMVATTPKINGDAERKASIEGAIQQLMQQAQATQDPDELHNTLIGPVDGLYKQVKKIKYLLPGVSPQQQGVKPSTTFAAADAKKMRKPKDTRSGIEKLAAKMATGRNQANAVEPINPEPKLEPVAKPAADPMIALDKMEGFVKQHQNDISPEGFASAMQALQAAKASPSPESISAAKAAVDAALEG